MSCLKNKDADANNPNLYQQYEDDNKLDHVYDEIKHKEGYGKYNLILICLLNHIMYINKLKNIKIF